MKVKTMKRLAALLLAAGLCVMGASAETVSEKTLTVISEGDGGRILTEPADKGGFWEAPSLTAGQGMENGVLRFVNEDKAAVDMRLKEIELPYGDEKALAYLDALRIRVTDGDKVLYEGPYTRIAEEGGLRIEETQLARGAEKTYGIALYCAFDYLGDPVNAPVTWRFDASPSAVVEEGIPAPEQPTWVLVLLCAAGALVIGCFVLGLMGVTRRGRKGPEE